MSAAFPFTYGSSPVPYTAAWTGEQASRSPTAVRWRCGHHGTLRFVSDGPNRPGDGKPLFTVLHADRCREVLERRLCQMCVKPLPRTFICVTSGTTLQGLPLVVDGLPMCPGCAVAAFEACPGLQRNESAGRLRIFALDHGGFSFAPKVLGFAEGPGSDERTNALIRKHGKIYSGPDLVLHAFRRLDLTGLRQMEGRSIEHA